MRSLRLVSWHGRPSSKRPSVAAAPRERSVATVTYRPWKPLDLALNCHPVLSWWVDGLDIHITTTFWDMVLEIEFVGGLAGFHAFDESTYQSTEGPPGPDALDSGDCKPLPWPFWKSESNDRIRLYGDLGQLLYENIDTYYLVGADTVLWFDVADCSPTITVKRPAEQGDAINRHPTTSDPSG